MRIAGLIGIEIYWIQRSVVVDQCKLYFFKNGYDFANALYARQGLECVVSNLWEISTCKKQNKMHIVEKLYNITPILKEDKVYTIFHDAAKSLSTQFFKLIYRLPYGCMPVPEPSSLYLVNMLSYLPVFKSWNAEPFYHHFLQEEKEIQFLK